ncbi:MAG TPA: phytoene/squalene synthase family protein [Spirochaetia bacterium]|nr:phytoene/squalene synthase family protein [Spirochaetia bacterium]
MGKAQISPYQTFKAGSKTYFTSSLFFPPDVKADVFTLYAFVRTADNFVDQVPQDSEGFASFRGRYRKAAAGEATGDPAADAFIELKNRKKFDPAWVEAFLDAMEADLSRRNYDTLEETLGYVYGSAEVIGLFMARLLDLPDESLGAARLLGRAMQYINFIRDIEEDITFGRRYLPLAGSGLPELSRDQAEAHPEAFGRFIEHHLALYEGWQREAEKGFAFIPRRYRVPIKTASDMYNWTARKIRNDPLVVFSRKVKPEKPRIVFQAFANAIAG